MKSVRLITTFLFIFHASFGQTWQDSLSLIDRTFSQYQAKNPGCQLAVSRNGETIFSRAWGMADLEHQVPLSNNSVFEAGSVSKQFTAAAILLLEQQGKLSLDDKVNKYIRELPGYGTPMTLRHLLHHTSGLRDWGDVVALTGWPRGQKFYTNEDVLEIICRQKQLNNKPGAEFLYSNSNYNLLTLIVQRVSGLTLAAFTQKYIFEPAGMTHTQWRDDPNQIVPNRAIAYSKSASGYKTNMPNEYVYGHGGLLTTAEDLLKWNNFYLSGKFGMPSLLSKQIRLEPLNNGVINSYAAGLFINKVMGWNNINHNGATASYRAYLETFPELHLSIAILSNTSEFNINNVASMARKIFVPGGTEEKMANVSGISLPEAYLKTLAGMYVNERNHSTFELSVKNDTLILDNSVPLVATSANIFTSDNFLFDIKGTKGLYIPFSPRDTIHFIKVKPANLSEKDLKTYEGKYFSEESNSSLTVQHHGSKLMLRLNADKAWQLIPTYKDAFKVDELDCDVQFIRAAKNKISAIRFYFWRARGIEFIKAYENH
jgi:CubicO group peptidase (beta-lactamase class C family)